MNLMLLCAGEGTRFRPQTLTVPKPALPFLTVPLAAYGLQWAQELAPRKLVVNTYHLPGKIHELFHRLNHGCGSLAFSDEAPKLMGSGGGIWKAQALLGQEDFLLMNGDEIFLPTSQGQLAEVAAKHRSANALATFVVIKYPGVGTHFGGVWTDGAENVLGFGKSAPIDGAHGWHYIGVMLLSPRIFKYLPAGKESNIIYDGLVAGMQAQEHVQIYVANGWWHETGNEVDYLKATGTCLRILADGEGDQARFLEAILRKHNPSTELTVSGKNIFLRSSSAAPIPPTSEGFVVLGQNSGLSGTENKNAVLGDGIRADQSVQNHFLV